MCDLPRALSASPYRWSRGQVFFLPLATYIIHISLSVVCMYVVHSIAGMENKICIVISSELIGIPKRQGMISIYSWWIQGLSHLKRVRARGSAREL